MAALDIRQKQILVRYDDDANFTWHHRVLLWRARDSEWVVLTPTLEVQRLDVSTVPVVPLGRGRPIPAAQREDCFIFDDTSQREINDHIPAARALAELFGEVAEPDDEEIWVVSSTAHDKFGEIIDPAVLQDEARSTLRTKLGVVQLDENDEDSEVHVERVRRGGLEQWRQDRAGGGDLRLLGTFRGESGRRQLGTGEAIEMCVESKFVDFPFEEPRVCLEFLRGLADAPQGSFDSYHRDWIGASGVTAQSSVAHDHRVLLEMVRLALQYDQICLPNTALGEQLCRRLVQHEMAVERDAKHPDYSGLGGLVSTGTEETGRVPVPKFTKFVADRQHARAQVLKQGRLLREEKSADYKRRKGKGKGKDKEQADAAGAG